MLDPNFIRQNVEKAKKATKDKGRDPVLVDKWLKIDQTWRKILTEVESLRAERNKLTDELKKADGKPPQGALDKGKKIKEELQNKEKELVKMEREWKEAIIQIPNLPADDVKVGKDESENEVVKTWGDLPKFDFPVKDYQKIGEDLGLIDIQRAGKTSGSRFGFLTGDLVLLELALLNLAFETLTEKGFIPVIPPVMLKKEMEAGLGYAEAGGWDDMYILEKDNLVLTATAEHSLVSRHTEEIVPEKSLPLKYVGFSTCFRREAGSYGRDTKGILRVHQFNKVEMVVFTRHEDAEETHQEMVNIEEELMQQLKIPYRLVKMCSGDLGSPAAKKYDIEAWFPGEEKYRETHSCSNCTDYQSRRLNIRFSQKGKLEFVYILNGTVFSERPLLAILENYQQKNGSVVIPEVLRKWIGKDIIQ